MAHLQEFATLCDGCNRKPATKQLFNRMNAPCGKFCASCAKSRLRMLEQIESQSARAPRSGE